MRLKINQTNRITAKAFNRNDRGNLFDALFLLIN